MLRGYFEEKNKKELLVECENATKSGNELSDDLKCKCVNVIADYAADMFSLDIQTHQIKQLALATVSLINALSSKTGEPTVS